MQIKEVIVMARLLVGMFPVSTCKAVSWSVEAGICICVTKLGKQTSTMCKRSGSIYTPRFLSAPLAQLALALMPALPVNNKPNT